LPNSARQIEAPLPLRRICGPQVQELIGPGQGGKLQPMRLQLPLRLVEPDRPGVTPNSSERSVIVYRRMVSGCVAVLSTAQALVRGGGGRVGWTGRCYAAGDANVKWLAQGSRSTESTERKV